jgi:hypothetical protein
MTIEEMIQKVEQHCFESECTSCVLRDQRRCYTKATYEELGTNCKLIDDEKNGLKQNQNAIKDSGERTQFYDGDGNPIGVRDMHEGKGRLDLLPCTAILELAKHSENGCKKYGERSVDKGIPQHSFIDSGLRHLFKYLRGDKDENHLVSALWNIAWAVEQDVNKPELNDLPWAKEE